VRDVRESPVGTSAHLPHAGARRRATPHNRFVLRAGYLARWQGRVDSLCPARTQTNGSYFKG